MKRELKFTMLGAFGVIVLVMLMSLTYKEADKQSGHSPQVIFTVPVRPKSTVIVDECKVRMYLRNGYQVQNAWFNNRDNVNRFVLVKY